MSDLREAASQIENLRLTWLLGDDNVPEMKLQPMAEQYSLLALTALEQAQRYMRLADYHQMRNE